MGANQNYDALASRIIECLGGKDNMAFINHCATRLRVNLKDKAAADLATLKKVKGVLGLSEAEGNEVQVIIGQTIEDVYAAVIKQTGERTGGTKTSSGKGILGKFAEFLMMMAGIMSPVIPALLAAGLLGVFMLVAQWCGVPADSSTLAILNNLQQSVFYFMPVYVAYTAAKKFGTEPVLAMVLCAFLIYPDWNTMVNTLTAEGQTFTSYFGIPTMLNTYSSSVLQPVLAVFVMSKIDTWLKKVLPVSVRHVTKPFLLLLLSSVITLPVLAPLGAFFTNYIYAAVTWLRTVAPWLGVPAIVIFSTTVGVFMPGFHMALMPIAFTSLATVGYDDLINIWFYCCTVTPAFIALAVALKTKKKALKDVAYPASLSAFFGISEPTTYGISYKIPAIYMISAATSITASIVSGILKLKSYGFGAYALTNFLLFLGPDKDMGNFIRASIVLVIMAVMAFGLVFAVKWDDSAFDEEPEDTEGTPVAGTAEKAVTGNAVVKAAAEGTFIEMKDINDAVMAGGALGTCFGVKPATNEVKAPVTGVVNSVAPTKHAITIYGDNGEQVMVHIGLDSVKLNGMGIQAMVKAGQRIKAGERIATYQKKMFESEGIDDTVITLLLNSGEYSEVTVDPETAEIKAVK